MATLYITEFGIGSSPDRVPVSQLPPLAEQTLAISGSSGASSAFNANTRLVRVHTDAICSIAVGAAPTAATTNMRLPADATEYFAVKGGDKIAVISNT